MRLLAVDKTGARKDSQVSPFEQEVTDQAAEERVRPKGGGSLSVMKDA